MEVPFRALPPVPVPTREDRTSKPGAASSGFKTLPLVLGPLELKSLIRSTRSGLGGCDAVFQMHVHRASQD